MEIDITALFNETDASDFSRSVAEYGFDAGPTSWANAKAEGAACPLLITEEELQALRDWAGEFGAWDDQERAAWDADECNALLIQYVSGNIREIEGLCMGDDGEIDWSEVERLEQAGTISGGISPDGEGRIWLYLGS